MYNVVALLMAPPSGAGGAEGFLISLLPIFAMLAILWFLLIRPQQQEQRKHTDLVRGLKKGDEVVTVGGVYGRIMSLNEEKVSIKVADNVKIDVERTKVVRVLGRESGAEAG